MKRRSFLKLLSGLPLIGALPVLAKQKTMVFDGVDSYLKVDAFELNEPATIYGLHKPFKLKGVMYFDEPLTAEEQEKILNYAGRETHVFTGEKSRMVLNKCLPIGLKG